jgi:hypothetical protein
VASSAGLLGRDGEPPQWEGRRGSEPPLLTILGA